MSDNRMKPHQSVSKRDGKPFHNKNQKKRGFHIPKKQKREVTFDAEARRLYLQGFSERKRQRRAYGLAMQKVKDRRSKLQEKRESKQAELEQIEQAESQKRQALLCETRGGVSEQDEENEEDDDTSISHNDTTATTIMYQDVQTQSQFGGQVIVTTTTMPPGDDKHESDDSSEQPTRQQKTSIDSQQKYAGTVDKYLDELKRKMPAKKKSLHGHKHKGRHGAAGMKGMGGASNLKVAQKALAKIQAKKEQKGKGKHRKR